MLPLYLWVICCIVLGHNCFDSAIGLRFDTAIWWFTVRTSTFSVLFYWTTNIILIYPIIFFSVYFSGMQYGSFFLYCHWFFLQATAIGSFLYCHWFFLYCHWFFLQATAIGSFSILPLVLFPMALSKQCPLKPVMQKYKLRVKGHCFDSAIGLRFNIAIYWFNVWSTSAVPISEPPDGDGKAQPYGTGF